LIKIVRLKKAWIFGCLTFICLLALYFWQGQHDIIFLRPQSVHQWAQCDRASVALNYFQEDMNFFKPRVHNLDNGSGITGLEFPIVNYSVAVLYSLFGFYEWIYRVFMLILFSIGMMVFSKIAKYYLKDSMLATGVTLLYAATPLLMFYAASFLPDVAALSFFLVSWWILLKEKIQSKARLIYWTLFFALAALIKISILIYLPPIMFLVFQNEETKKQIKHYLLASAAVMLIVFAWYFYAAALSKSTNSEVFLLRMIWVKSFSEFISVFKEIRVSWINRLYPTTISLVLFFLPLIFLMLSFFKSKLKYFAAIAWLTLSVFLLLMWPQLRHHDYYMISLSVIFPVVMILICQLLIQFKIPLRMLSLLVFALALNQGIRSKENLEIVYNKSNWQYGYTHFDLYFNLDSSLANLGVKPEDQIVSVYDHTPDISLYLINHKGVGVTFHDPKNTINAYLKSGQFKYLLYNVHSEYGDSPFQSDDFPLKFIGKADGLDIYSVNSYRQGSPNKAFNLYP